MRLKLASALLLFSLTPLAGCGFTPVYSTDMDASAGSIQIDQIDGRSGHILRRELVSQLRAGLPGIEQAQLVVELQEGVKDFDYSPDGSSSRTHAIAIASYELITSRGVLTGQVSGSSSYVTPSAPYGDITARLDATSRAAMDAATRLVTDLQLKTGNPDNFKQPK